MPESPEHHREGMNEQEAYQLAKMIWANMGVDRRGRIITNEPQTPEERVLHGMLGIRGGGYHKMPEESDYQAADSLIGELKRLAVTESSFEKFKNSVARALTGMSSKTIELVKIILFQDHEGARRTADNAGRLKRKFSGPSKQLKDLRRKGEKLEQSDEL